MTKDHARGEDVVKAKRDIRSPQKEQEQEVVAGLVSVVIPCYNQAHFLGEAIESVLAQSYKDFEIIVVDDGSPDNTSEVAAYYTEVRLVRQENRGLAGARNTGIRESEGEYLVFLDADDRLLPEALEAHLEHLKANSECAFVSGHYKFMTNDGSPLSERPSATVSKDRYLELLDRNYVVVPAVVMYRRAILETVGGFDTSLSPAADYEMYLRIARKFAVCRHEKVVAEYRQHDSNMSGNSALMLSATVGALRSQRKHIRGHKRYREAYKLGLKRWQGNYGNRLVDEVRAHLRKRRWKLALRGTLVLLRYHPWGLTLPSERRMERREQRRKLARQVQARRDELEVRERRLKELESAQDAQSALAEEHQEVQELKRRIRWLERRIQEFSLQARLRARIGQSGKVRQRLLDRVGRLRIALLSERRMERRRLAQRLQTRRDELKACERRIKELEGARKEEPENVSLLAKERQEAQQHRRRIRRLERRMRSLSLQARLRARIRQNRKNRQRLLERLGRTRAKVSRR